MTRACFMTGRTLREHLVESGHTTEREGHEQLVETDRAPASAFMQSWQPSIGLCLEASPFSGCVSKNTCCMAQPGPVQLTCELIHSRMQLLENTPAVPARRLKRATKAHLNLTSHLRRIQTSPGSNPKNFGRSSISSDEDDGSFEPQPTVSCPKQSLTPWLAALSIFAAICNATPASLNDIADRRDIQQQECQRHQRCRDSQTGK